MQSRPSRSVFTRFLGVSKVLYTFALLVGVLYSTPALAEEQFFASTKGCTIVLRHQASRVIDDLRSLSKPEQPSKASTQEHTNSGFAPYSSSRTFFAIVPSTGSLSAVMEQQKLSSTDNASHRGIESQTIGVKVRRVGVSRGHHIARIDVSLLTSSLLLQRWSVLDECVIQLRFSEALSKKALTKNELPLLSVVNEEFSEFSTPNPSAAIPLTENTPRTARIDSASLPLAVHTTRDGVAKILGSAILQAHPEWKGVATSSLHLHFKAQEQRVYIPASTKPNAEYLSAESILYFYGQHAEDDTTWYSAYTRERVYYLSVDSTVPSLRYAERTPTNNGPELSSMRLSRHFEEEYDYVQGFSRNRDEIDWLWTDNAEGERWIWQPFDRYQDFSYTIPLLNSSSSTDSMRMHLVYESVNDFPGANPDKRVQILVNGDTLYDETFEGAQVKELDIPIPKRLLQDGSFTVTCRSLGFNTTVREYSERQALDYFHLEGQSRALAIKGHLFGSVDASQSSMLRVGLVRSPQAVLLDTLQAAACVLDATSVNSCIASTRRLPRPWTSMLYNGRVLRSSVEKALHISVLAPSVDTVLQWNGASSDREAAVFLQKAPSGSVVFVSSNDSRAFSSELSTTLSNMGFNRATTKAATAVYVGVQHLQSGKAAIESIDNESAQLFDTLRTASSNCFEARVPLAVGKNEIVLSSSDSIETCAVRVSTLSDLRNSSHSADYLVIYHPIFEQQAKRLADYRAKQGHRTEVVSVEDIYQEFSDGQKTPHAIRSFLKHAYNFWSGPKIHDVVLFGDASWDNRQIIGTSVMRDYVPSFGKPVSDIWFSLLDSADRVCDFNIGRIPVQTPLQAEQLVAKIMRYDSLPPNLWWKTFLYISGGQTSQEKIDFLDYNRDLQTVVLTDDPMFRARSICGDTNFVTTLYNETNTAYSASGEISKAVNGTGVCWINFVGHGSPQLTDVNDWDASTLANTDRPFMLATLSCQTAAFAEPQTNCIDENFLFADQKGAIAAMGSTGYGIPVIQSQVMRNCFYEMALYQTRKFGNIFSNALAIVGTHDDVLYRDVFLQCCLLGDPLCQIPFDTVAHPVLLNSGLRITDRNGSTFITDDQDSAFVRLEFFNAGVHGDSATVEVIHTYAGKSDTTYLQLYDLCMTNTVEMQIPVLGANGEHSLKILADTGRKTERSPRFPSELRTAFSVYSPRPLPIDPLPYWNVSATHPILRAISPSKKPNQFVYETRLQRGGEVVDSVSILENDLLTVDECYVEWQPKSPLIVGDRYTLSIRSTDTTDSKKSAWLEIPVVACADSLAQSIFIQADVAHEHALFTTSSTLRRDSAAATPGFVLNKHLAYSMRSAVGYGYYDSLGQLQIPLHPTIEIRLDGITYGDRDDLRGFGVRLMNRRTGIVREVRTFDCFIDKDTCDTCFNGSGRTLYRFLRDSIQTDDYVFMAICGNSYGDVFVQRDQDSLHLALKMLGSTLYDSVVSPHSYIMLASKAEPKMLMEKLRLDTLSKFYAQDTVKTSGTVLIQPDSGWVKSIVYGPAKRWTRVQYTGQLADSVASIQLHVYGLRNPFATPELLKTDTLAQTSLSDIDAQVYPYIQTELVVQRRSVLVDPRIEAMRIDLEALPELAVIPSSITLSRDSVLRGDTIVVTGAAKRISPRARVDSAVFVYDRQPLEGAGLTSKRTVVVQDPAPDSVIMIVDTASTLAFAGRTRNLYTVDPVQAFPELYRFNNSLGLDQVVLNDTEAPVLEIDIDSMPTYTNMVVARNPFVRCVLRDNSRMPITESWRLSATINGNESAILSSPLYRFSSSPEILGDQSLHPSARATLQFSLQLETGINNLRISAVDFFGNETDSALTLIVDRDVYVLQSRVKPNPFSDFCTISYQLKSPLSRQIVRFEVYDLRGELVRSQELAARIGTNLVMFDGRDDAGRELMQGSYYYRLFVSQNGSIDSDHGMLVIVR